jgi:hypothetical protein
VGNNGVNEIDALGLIPAEFNLQKYSGSCLPASAANLINYLTDKKITTDEMIEVMVEVSTRKITVDEIRNGGGGFMDDDLIAAMNKIGGVECKAISLTYEELVNLKGPSVISIESGQKHAVVLTSINQKGVPTIIDPFPDPDNKDQKCCKPEGLDITLKEILVFFNAGKIVVDGNTRKMDGTIKKTRIIRCTAK